MQKLEEIAMMIRQCLVVLYLFYFVSTCCGILIHGPSNSSHPNGITSHEGSTQQKFEQELTELQNMVAKLSTKLLSLEQNHTEMEKENLNLKALVKHLNRSFTLQQYESRMLTIQLASMELDLRTLNNASNKTNKDVSNLSNITLDIRQTLVKNNEQDQNNTRHLNEMEIIMNKTNNDVSNLYNITSDIRHSMMKDDEEDKNSTRRLSEIERVMNYLKAQLRSSAVSSIDMERRADEMNSSMMLLNTTILNLQKDLSIKVAFTAGMTTDDGSFAGGTLVFPAVITNIGGGYNPSTGIFTAPNDGLYVFYVSGVEYYKQYLRLDIVLNGVSKVRLIAHSSAAYQTGTNMAVLNLQQGDRVWVKHTYGSGYISQDVPLTTFSGFQI